MPITHLNEGGVCFLVQIEKNDEDIKKGIDEDHFKQYLEQEKFKNPGFGFWGCSWYFINIDSMVYVPGRLGIAYANPIGGHAITEEEFKTIWEIFKSKRKEKDAF